MNLKRFLSWRNTRTTSLKRHFFDDVCIEDKKLQDDIMDWIFRLNYNKNISVNKFSDLFSKFELIVFPIKVSGYPRYLQIQDKLGKEYYLSYSSYNYNKLGEYTIGRRAFPYDKEFVYRLTPTNEIILQELAILQLDSNDTNTDNILNFYYNSETQVTTAIFENKTLSLEITYPVQDYIRDNAILVYLFSLTSYLTHIDDTFLMLPCISDTLKSSKKQYSFTIKSYMKLNDNKKLLSEICVSDGVVIQYSFTTRPSDSEVCLNQLTLSEEIEKFILSHKN